MNGQAAGPAAAWRARSLKGAPMRRWRATLAGMLLTAAAATAFAGSYDDFFRAIRRDDPRAIRQLLLRGFDADTRDPQGRSGLHLALQVESYVAADALLGAPSIAVDEPNANDETPLMLAAIKGELALCQRLVARGAQVIRPGWAPLHYAASAPQRGEAIVDWLISRGADVDAEAPNGTTPLMMAARYGSFASVERLLAAGAATHVANDQGLRASDFAETAGRSALAKRLAAGAGK